MRYTTSVGEELRGRLSAAVARHPFDGVLFSGGIDSSIIAFEGLRSNPSLLAITAAVSGRRAPDLKYARHMATRLGLRLHIAPIDVSEIDELATKVVLALKTFNTEWVSAAMTLYAGCRAAKERGLQAVASGEGSDDLFGSFPVFQTWAKGAGSLADVIAQRMKDIAIMTADVSHAVGISVVTPFHDHAFANYALSLPIELRTRKTPRIRTKFPLRKAYSGLLPENCTYRPQTMAFTGAGTHALVMRLGQVISNAEFRRAQQTVLPFRCKSDYYLFLKFARLIGYYPSDDPHRCLHCCVQLPRAQAVHCRTCGTLQFDGEILPF